MRIPRIPGLDLWQSILLLIIILFCLHYLYLVLMDRLTELPASLSEGFEDTSMAQESQGETLVNEEIYDDFYASMYHKIFMTDKLVQAEAAIALHDWTKVSKPEEIILLDVGCGTGVATCYFAKQNLSKVIGLDRSKSMLRYAKNEVLPKTTLTEKQLSAIEWRLGDAYGAGIVAPSSVTHACLFHFTVYEFRDLEALLRNIALWVRPGGQLVIEAVNKYKFEPIPDVGNPWVGTTPQKYSKERITRAKATFDKFDYESEFELEDPRAEFTEVFKFKDGTTRRQRHVVWMPSIKEITEKASLAGWTYSKFIDLNMIGFNYGYLLFFTRNPN
jgi:SAM-dependent methyltransferase